MLRLSREVPDAFREEGGRLDLKPSPSPTPSPNPSPSPNPNPKKADGWTDVSVTRMVNTTLGPARGTVLRRSCKCLPSTFLVVPQLATSASLG